MHAGFYRCTPAGRTNFRPEPLVTKLRFPATGTQVLPNIGNNIIGSLHQNIVARFQTQPANVLRIMKARPLKSRAADADRFKNGHRTQITLTTHLPQHRLQRGSFSLGGRLEGQCIMMVMIHYPALINFIVKPVVVHQNNEAVGFKIPPVAQFIDVLIENLTDLLNQPGRSAGLSLCVRFQAPGIKCIKSVSREYIDFFRLRSQPLVRFNSARLGSCGPG